MEGVWMMSKNRINKTIRILGVIVISVFVIRLVGRGLLYLFLIKTGIGGAGDWCFDRLPGSYEIWRSSAYQIELVKGEDEFTKTLVVGPCVVAFCWDEARIGLRQIPDWDGSEANRGETLYYIVDTDSDKLYGPLDEAEYAAFCTSLQTDFGDWVGTSSAPPDAKR